MITSLYQIVLTGWLRAHPVTFTLPKMYPVSACMASAANLARHAKRGARVTIECVATDKRDA